MSTKYEIYRPRILMKDVYDKRTSGYYQAPDVVVTPQMTIGSLAAKAKLRPAHEMKQTLKTVHQFERRTSFAFFTAIAAVWTNLRQTVVALPWLPKKYHWRKGVYTDLATPTLAATKVAAPLLAILCLIIIAVGIHSVPPDTGAPIKRPIISKHPPSTSTATSAHSTPVSSSTATTPTSQPTTKSPSTSRTYTAPTAPAAPVTVPTTPLPTSPIGGMGGGTTGGTDTTSGSGTPTSGTGSTGSTGTTGGSTGSDPIVTVPIVDVPITTPDTSQLTQTTQTLTAPIDPLLR